MDGGLTEASRFTRFQSHRINKEIERTAISHRRWLVNKIKQPVAPPIRRYPSHVVRKQEIITGWLFVFPPVPPDVQLWRYVFLSSHTLLFGPVLVNRMWRRERVDIAKPGPLKRLFFRWAFCCGVDVTKGAYSTAVTVKQKISRDPVYGPAFTSQSLDLVVTISCFALWFVTNGDSVQFEQPSSSFWNDHFLLLKVKVFFCCHYCYHPHKPWYAIWIQFNVMWCFLIIYFVYWSPH